MREARELKNIRGLMGTDTFAKTVFDKVFTRDMERLRQMEDMWKTRKAPEPLDFDKVSEAAQNVMPQISTEDQKVWDLEENFTVFVDRHVDPTQYHSTNG